MRDQFTFYRSYWESLDELDDADRHAVIEAIICYALYEKTPDLKGHPNGYFKLIKPTLDSANKKAKAGKSKSQKNQTRNRTKSKTNQNRNKKEGENELEKESYDSFSNENESAPPAPTTKGGAARRWGTYDPEDDKREIVYKGFDDG